MLLPLYSKTLLFACGVVADHLRFHVVGKRVPLGLPFFYLSVARFYDRHVKPNSMRRAHPPRKTGLGLRHHGSSRIYRWIAVCVLTSVCQWAQTKCSTELSLGSATEICYKCCNYALLPNN
eukprot:2622546-Amphidinium_carterae.1